MRFKHYKRDGSVVYINGSEHVCEGIEVIESDNSNLHLNSLEADIINFLYSTFSACDYIEIGNGYIRIKREDQEVFLDFPIPEESIESEEKNGLS